jgi:hypothetical protein
MNEMNEQNERNHQRRGPPPSPITQSYSFCARLVHRIFCFVLFAGLWALLLYLILSSRGWARAALLIRVFTLAGYLVLAVAAAAIVFNLLMLAVTKSFRLRTVVFYIVFCLPGVLLILAGSALQSLSGPSAGGIP